MGDPKQPEEVDPNAETVHLGEAETVLASESSGSAAVPVVVQAGVASDAAEAVEVPQELANAIKQLRETGDDSLLAKLAEEGRLEVRRSEGDYYSVERITFVDGFGELDDPAVEFFIGVKPGAAPDMVDIGHKTVSFSLLEDVLRLKEEVEK